MTDHKAQKPDPLIDQVRDTRQRLIREHGNLRAWVDYLQQMQRQHPENMAPSPKKSAVQKTAD